MTETPTIRRVTIAVSAALLLALGTGVITGCARRQIASKSSSATVVAKKPSPPPVLKRARAPKLGTAPFRVCAFAFHSPDELAAIKAHLPPKDFDFVDLTPAIDASTASIAASASTADAAPGWLTDTCRADLRCDIVIYSGEFAGGFFGKYGVSLNVQEMEEASCQTRCQGLFHDPREVFLLACNTLATKSADERTPEVYLRVLRGHGFSRADAERVVNLRYGPLGPSFRESLRRIFMGVPRIYGFSSVAPCGEATAPRLHQYFQRTGDYAQYLARAGRDSTPNQDLLAAFAETSLVQITGLTPLDPATADRALVCKLYDDTQSVHDRLRVVQQMFSRSDFLAFVPTIEVFLNRHPAEQMRGDERHLLSDIRSLEEPRRQIIDLTYRLNVSALKMQMAHLARQLAWITPDEDHRLAAEGAKQLLAEPLSTEVVDIGCELTKYDAPAGAALRSEDIPEHLLWHSEGFRLLDCLRPTDPRVSERMLAGLENIDESTRLWAAYALSHRLPLDDSVLSALTRRLNDPSPGVRERLQWIFTAQAPLSSNVMTAIRARDPALARTLEAQATGRQ
ncbi:MAG TPA: hypothetical protein VMW17_24955 [Candidatus Binatia bacterium]|nr:hypothetical protein [Candidatus Binatia bacterium]